MRISFLLLSPLVLLSACSGPIQTEAPPPKAPEIVSSGNAALKPRRTPLSVGTAFPAFTLNDQKGIPVTDGELAAGKGSVLVFLPPPDSPGARPVYQWTRRERNFLRQNGLELLIVTPASVEANARLATTEELRVALLSDPASWVARAYGAVPEGQSHPIKPHIYILGPNGLIQFSSGSLPSASDLVMAAETQPGQPRESFLFR